ncbi:MAG: transcriptional regulator [Phenylobacterium zucineum]|nr:MAG: transcriptional regulator [Phenylobacterium zucineum]
MGFAEIPDPTAIAPRATATDKRQVLALISDIAARNFSLDAGMILDALAEREQAGSTGLGRGVAVPHARLEGLDRMRAVFLRLEHPVDFASVDDQPVDLVFALFSPADQGGSTHLQGLARISRLMRQKDLREQLRQSRTAEAIRALLVQDVRQTAA